MTEETDVTALTLTGNCYTLGVSNTGTEVGMRKYNGTSLRANSSYMDVESTGATRSFIGFSDDETTGISTLLTNWEKVNGEVYNLNGQRVSNPTKGLYIVNGKKILVK